ncbi:MAG: nucleolar RNA-binding Nop10p family protein [Candidatus Heimdallarchaeota archaeon]|nr:nucleolar RNA-binding Nop10p family protein [Candidatus Heimdallarchaeota archaeon]
MKCKDCSIYTLEMNCPGCGHSTVVPEPARFSVDDRFGIYRRGLKFKT